MAATSDAQGDAARTSESFTNQLKGLQANIKDVAVGIGDTLLPPLAKIITVLNTVFDAFNELSPEIKKTIVFAAGLSAGLGPLVFALGAATTAVGLMLAGFLAAAAPFVAAAAAIVGIGTALFHFRKEVASFVNIVVAKMLRSVVIGINDLLVPIAKLLKLVGIDLVDDLEALQKELLHTARGMDLMAIEVLQDTDELRALQKMAEGTAATFEGGLAPAIEAVTEGSLSLSEALFGVEDRLRAQKLAASEAAETTNDLLNTLIAFGGGAVAPVGGVGRTFRTLEDEIGGATDGIDQIIAAGNRAQTTITRSVAAQGVEWAKVKGQADQAAKNINNAMADIREAAGGIFDALLIRGESVFESLRNALKGGALSLGRAIFQDITEQLAGPILAAFRNSSRRHWAVS